MPEEAAKKSPPIPSSLYGVTPLDERHTPLNRPSPGNSLANISESDSPKSCLGKFRSLGGSPKELWFAFVIKFLDSIASYTLSLILVLFLTEEFGYSDVKSGTIYGAYGALSTFYGMFTGLLVDHIGVAKSIRLGLFLSVISRAILFSVTATRAGHILLLTMLLGIQPTANSLIYPVLMIGVRRYTVGANRGYAYGVFYAVMNVGALVAGPLIDIFRKYLPGDDILPDGTVPEENLQSFNWTPYRATLLVGVVASSIELLLSLFLNEIKVEEDRPDGGSDESSLTDRDFVVTATSPGEGNSSSGEGTTEELEAITLQSATTSSLRKTRVFVPSSTPALVSLKETLTSSSFWRFVTVGFVVTNMRMIFRHLDATLPKYMTREFGPEAPYGSIYAINPATVIVLTPILAAMTSEIESLRMIRYGMFVSAFSLIFIVAFDNTIWGCAVFIIVFSIGESLWSPRYYILSVTSAKEGKEGVFASFAFAPLFLAQLPVGALSGFLLQKFCPSEDNCEGHKLWGVIASLSALSPVLMVILWPFIHTLASEDNDHELSADDERGGLAKDASPSGFTKDGGASPTTGPSELAEPLLPSESQIE